MVNYVSFDQVSKQTQSVLPSTVGVEQIKHRLLPNRQALSWFSPGKVRHKFADRLTSTSVKTNLRQFTLSRPFMDRSAIDSLGVTLY